MSHTGDNFNFELDNLRGHFIEKRNVVILTGSIHKYARGGYNFDDFNYRDLMCAFKKIARIFKTSLTNIKIVGVEIGINLAMSSNAKNYFNCFKFYKSNPFIYMNPLPGTSTFRGVRCCGCSMVFKLYDKTYEARRKSKLTVPEDLLRIEVKLTSNFLRRNKLIYFANEISIEVFKKYLKILDDAFYNSQKIETYSTDQLTGLKPKTAKDYFFIISENYKDYREFLKGSKIGLKQEIARSNKTLKDVVDFVGKSDYLEELETLYCNKRKALLV